MLLLRKCYSTLNIEVILVSHNFQNQSNIDCVNSIFADFFRNVKFAIRMDIIDK